MRSVCGAVLMLGLIALARGFPGAGRDASSSEVDDSKNDGVVLLMPHRGIFDAFDDDDDSDADDDTMGTSMWPPFHFNSNPFNDLFVRMQDAMNKIRAQMAAALHGQFGQAGLTPWGKIPEGANTTSTTKVIDGHAVTINETTYSDGDDNSGTIIRVRVVDIKPLNETTDAIADGDTTTTTKPKDDENVGSEQVDKEREELTTPKARETETLEDFNNEIPKNQFETLDA
ncbi:icarapin-like [Phymastichus coffea]|uniref:icarapin-like n=1 Tax=Phymastichus coffea TaxID=108790 RepID=UPI00273CC22B|nr:icarapin-like [Phymastichus coffea]